MRWFLAGGFLAWFAVSSVRGQDEEKFAACAAKTGKAYLQARDQFLAGPAQEAFLEKKLDSKEWRERLAARILLGWSRHKEAYRQLLATPKVTNQAGASHYEWSIGRKGIQEKDMPLMYELLMKDIDPKSARDAASALAALAGRKPKTPLDVPLLHQFLQDKKGGSAAARSAVAWLIGSLPAKFQIPQELKKSLQAELEKGKERGITLALLDGLHRAAKNMNSKEKDGLVAGLLQMKVPLEDVVGKTPLTYAIGNIGGDQASGIVARYFAKNDDNIEKLWAIRALSKSDSVVATRMLLKYAGETKAAIKDEVIEGLGRARYLPEVAAKLQTIALDKKASESQQLLALRSLATILNLHPKDGALQKEIQSRMRNIGDTNTQLRKAVKELLLEGTP